MSAEPAVCSPRIPKDRVASLTDAIFAFAMTLLVITVDIPARYAETTATAPVRAILGDVVPDLLHFFIAFVLLAILWYFDHQRFHSLACLDRLLLVLHITALAFICLLPFSTNLAGDFPYDPLGSIFFEFNILIIGLLACAQWLHIRRHAGDFVPGMSPLQIRQEIRWSLVFPALSVAGIALALLSVPWSVGIYVLAPVIMAAFFWHPAA